MEGVIMLKYQDSVHTATRYAWPPGHPYFIYETLAKVALDNWI